MIEEEREETVDARKSSARSAAHASATDVAAEKLKAAASSTTLSLSTPETATTKEPQQIHTPPATEGTGLSVQEIQAIGDLAMGSSVSTLFFKVLVSTSP